MQLRAMAMAMWLLPVPVEAASYCRVSGVSRFGSTIRFIRAAARSVVVVGSKRHAGADHFVIRPA